MKKRKFTTEEKQRKKARRAEFQIIFINGRQKRVRRPPLIDGLSVDEFVGQNADPIWLHLNGMWELMPENQKQATADQDRGYGPWVDAEPSILDERAPADFPQSPGTDTNHRGFEDTPF